MIAEKQKSRPLLHEPTGRLSEISCGFVDRVCFSAAVRWLINSSEEEYGRIQLLKSRQLFVAHLVLVLPCKKQLAAAQHKTKLALLVCLLALLSCRFYHL